MGTFMVLTACLSCFWMAGQNAHEGGLAGVGDLGQAQQGLQHHDLGPVQSLRFDLLLQRLAVVVEQLIVESALLGNLRCSEG